MLLQAYYGSKAALHCTKGEQLWDLADFLFRSLRLRRAVVTKLILKAQ